MLKQLAKLRDHKGASLLETVLTLPLLIMATLMLLQMGISFWVLSSQQQATNEAIRQYSLGYVDDESHGNTMPCNSVSGLTPTGLPSVEAWLCQRLQGIPGEFAVSANDGHATTTSPAGTTLTISTSVDTSSVLLFDLQGVLASLTSQHTTQQRNKE